MGGEQRLERRRVRWFFAGLLAVSAVIDLVGATVINRVTRSQVLESMFPPGVTLGGRVGAVLTGLTLLLLAVGIARGKRVAFRLSLIALGATIAFELVKDLDIEEATLFAWTMFGLWMFRDHHFDEAGDETHMFWETKTIESYLLPVATDRLSLHVAKHTYTIPGRQQPARVEMRMKIRPIGMDVLQDLVDSGDLDPALLKEMPTFTLNNTHVEWKPSDGQTVTMPVSITPPAECFN